GADGLANAGVTGLKSLGYHIKYLFCHVQFILLARRHRFLNFENNRAIKGLGKIMPTIGYTISVEESTNIVKKAILWNASVYPLIYKRVLVDAKMHMMLSNFGVQLTSIKSQIMHFFDSPGAKHGIKIFAVKVQYVMCMIL
ncbi:4164_t:CDS:2, partial [Racocetra persica]